MRKLQRFNYSYYLGGALVSFLLILCVLGPMIALHGITETMETKYIDGKVTAPPVEPFENSAYPLGTDKWGYDLLSIILYGLRYTVMIALAVTVLKMSIGTLVGIYAGTWKKTPGILVAFENAWSYIPLFIILYFFLLPITFNSALPTNTLIGYFIMITAAVSIPSIVSSVRLKTKELSKGLYIEAAKTLGANRNRIVWKHIFPQMKESLLVMFVIEVVHVIALMGQLALMNIFVGGTIMRFDPVIYLSQTKELAGLVGQARGNMLGSEHILIVPLAALLVTTTAFMLLANGLKRKYQIKYKKTPWIKTGQEL